MVIVSTEYSVMPSNTPFLLLKVVKSEKPNSYILLKGGDISLLLLQSFS